MKIQGMVIDDVVKEGVSKQTKEPWKRRILFCVDQDQGERLEAMFQFEVPQGDNRFDGVNLRAATFEATVTKVQSNDWDLNYRFTGKILKMDGLHNKPKSA